MGVDEDRALWEKNLRFSTPKVDGKDGDRLDFTIICNGKRFIVAVYGTPHSGDPITPLLSQYNRAFLEDDGDKNLQKAQDKIEDIIYDAGWRKFALLVPGNETGPSSPPISLKPALNPETLYFRLIIDAGSADVIQEYPSRPRYVPSYLKVTSNLPRYSAQEILLTKKLMGTGYIAKVSVNGQDMCCKMLVPTNGKAVQREYECLEKIADSKHASSIKAPRLIGFVVNGGDDDDGVIGILEEYIPHTMNLGWSQGKMQAIARVRACSQFT